MTIMKRVLVLSLLCFFLLSPVVVFGQTSPDCENVASERLCNPIRFSKDDLGTFATKAVATASTFFTLVALIMVVYSGFRMAISQGDEEQITLAKRSLTWSIYGLILSMFAFVLIYAMSEFIGAQNVTGGSYSGNNRVQNPLEDPTFALFLERLLTRFLQISGLIAILMIVIGGFRYITAAGNEEAAEKGKKTFQWAALGLITILLAYVLVRATLTFFFGG